MNDRQLQIPHICERIADNLSFADLLSCILVSCQWYDCFISSLYQDIITYRSLVDLRGHWKYDYSRNTFVQQALFKHAHHIQALTCHGRHSLRTLLTLNCVNLLEINYVIGSTSSNNWNLGLRQLADLIAANPRLQAVSIENIHLHNKSCVNQLSKFLDFIDSYPRISCLYLETKDYFCPSQREQWRPIWYRLLARIVSDDIRSLSIPSHVRRSMRGHGGQPWPAKERNRTDPQEYCGGRWEQDPGILCFTSNLAVLQRGDKCQITIPAFATPSEWLGILARFPNLHSLSIDVLGGAYGVVMDAIRLLLPELTRLNISKYYSGRVALEHCLSELHSLSSLGIGVLGTRFRFSAEFNQHFGALVTFNTNELTMGEFLCIVAQCPKLTEFIVRRVVVLGTEGSTSPEWTCKGLQRLSFKVGEDHALYVAHDHSPSQTMYLVRRLAPSFMNQLGSLSNLVDLSMGFDLNSYPGDSPFLQLSLDPVCGLPQLKDLVRLRTVAISGVQQSVGQCEMEWMRRHWPKLLSLETPFLHSDFALLMPVQDYQKWFPRLRIVTPEHIHEQSDDGSWARVMRF